MVKLLNCEQMRAAELAEMHSGRVTGLQLMERAGRSVVEALLRRWPKLAKNVHKCIVLCGPGNNGGDGFVIAQDLQARGWRVEVFMLGQPENLPVDARACYKKWQGSAPATALHDISELTRETCVDADLLVDALFGTGLTRPLDTGLQQQLWDALVGPDRSVQRVVAVDIPSGLCGDSGKVLGEASHGVAPRFALQADLTVSFHCRKLGHVLGLGPHLCGTVEVADIGLPDGSSDLGVVTDAEFSSEVLDKRSIDHKYSNGAALILSGGAGKSGAARLAARAALRIGAGIVTLGVPKAAQSEVAAQITSLMMTQVESASDLEKSLGDPRLKALCLGPGLGFERAFAMVPPALSAQTELRVVLDADALSAFEEDPAELFEQLNKGCVLTPHMGEFRRLFPDIALRLVEPAMQGPAYSKVDAVRAAANRAGCTVLLKGADTVIANEIGQCRIHSATGTRAAPWLATAGAGDVLAGFITGLLARGFAPLDSASIAAHLHVGCALEFGAGLIAEDLPDILPSVLNRLLAEV